MTPSFPFSAIVGQETLKRALVLGIIQPSLGGVLIRGTKGLAKSTAVRSLASFLPPIQTVAGCPFQRRPGEEIADWPLPADAPSMVRPVPLVELPLGATEDRVLGSLHLEKALRGERAFEPGLLAAANRGILYIDEVNLLPDHLVDILLDAAATGVHRLEREGLSLSHPANFVLIGTMNPEEGDLRPQLLDRFGLVADIADLSDASERAEAVRRRLAFEADPTAFCTQWKSADEAEARRLVTARELLPRVKISSAILQAISQRCLEAGTDGLRADLTMARAASAWAAYLGRTEVENVDVEAVAEMALAHRRTRPPQQPDDNNRGSKFEDRGSKIEDRSSRSGDKGPAMERRGTAIKNQQGGDHDGSRSSIFQSAGLFVPRPRPGRCLLGKLSFLGRWRQGTARHRGPSEGKLRIYQPGSVLSWGSTLRAAALFQADRGRCGSPVVLKPEDLRGRSRHGPAGVLLLFVIDASGSMGAWQRMRRTKSAVLSLLVRAYQRRDQVALVVFRGHGAECVLPPTRRFRTVWRAIEQLPVGGTTPLAHGLAECHGVTRRHQRRQPRQPMWVVLLTDGRANVPLHSGDSWLDALCQGRALALCGVDCLVVDTETGWPRFGRAIELARAMDAHYMPLDEVLGRPLPDVWSKAV
jgi:magnesium chelatase subunit D